MTKKSKKQLESDSDALRYIERIIKTKITADDLKSTIKNPDMYAGDKSIEKEIVKDIDFDDSSWYNN